VQQRGSAKKSRWGKILPDEGVSHDQGAITEDVKTKDMEHVTKKEKKTGGKQYLMVDGRMKEGCSARIEDRGVF